MTDLNIDTSAIEAPIALERTAPADTPATLSSHDAAAVLRKLRQKDTTQPPPQRRGQAPRPPLRRSREKNRPPIPG